MGREQDLLEAARSGNVTQIEKLLNPRKKLTVGSLPLQLGPFPSLRRAPNPNCHDQNGDTPLHLAALNGHIEVVKILLQHEGSANIMDNKGCYPLHLAAWSGNAEMCNVLLSHGPSIAKVNEQNLFGETALHCAAQYGHTATIAVLLPHRADPLIRNNRSETGLDLASQYGRLDSVELLVRKHPGLLTDDNDTHSPVHLAARNGHRHVVQLLLDAGFDSNKVTDSGTALHDAAVFGKQDVVRLLLRRGINATLTDSSGRTVLELLSEHKSQLSLDTGRIILDYLEGRSITDKRSSTQSACSDLLDPGNHGNDRLLSESDAVIGGERRSLSTRSSGDSSVFGATGGGRISTVSDGFNIYDVPKTRYVPPGLDEVDAISDTSGSPLSVSGGLSLSSASHPLSECSHGSNGSVARRSPQQNTPKVATPDTPKKPPRRKPPSSVLSSVKASISSTSPPIMVFLTKRSSTTSRDSASGPESLEKPEVAMTTSTVNMRDNDNNNGGNNNVVPTATQNDNDKCDNASNTNTTAETDGISSDIPSRKDSTKSFDADVANSNHQMAASCTDNDESQTDFVEARRSSSHNNNDSDKGNIGDGVEQRQSTKRAMDSVEFSDTPSKEVKGRTTVVHSTIAPLPRKDFGTNPETDFDMGTSSSNEAKPLQPSLQPQPQPGSQPSSRPPSLDFSSKRSSAEVPLSPTGYQQPPTPDHPPPSPMTAVLGIQEKINPREKRRSRDMETITELEFLQIDRMGPPPTTVPTATSKETKETPPTNDSSHPKHSPGGSPVPVEDSLEGATGGTSHSPGGSSSVLRRKGRGSSGGERRGSGDGDVEIFVNGNNPFLGLTKGAIPKGQRRIKSQIFENIPQLHGRSSAAAAARKRISAPGLYATFGPLMEGDDEGDAASPHRPHSKGRESAAGARASLRRSLIQQAARADGEIGCEGGGGEGGSANDENDEWAQIADILSSCGGRMSTSEYSGDYGDFERRLQKIFAEEKGRLCVLSVGDWLENLGLPQYENLLVANGFDDMDFLGPNVLEDSDLLELGITDSADRQKILEESQKRSPVKPIVEGKTPSSVDDWLSSLRLSDYLETFQTNNFSSMDRVRNIWELELNSVLDINTLGHRKRILASLRVPPEADTVSQSDDFLDFTKINEWSGRPTETEELSLYKDYTNVRPRSRHRESTEREDGGPYGVEEGGAGEEVGEEEDEEQCELCLQEQNGGQDLSEEPSVQIRPPNSSADNSAIKQWRHQPEVLIKGCCNYTVQYLGSTLVKSLQGTESTRESIHKMKKSTDSIAKVPSVVLSVSYRGVKFIDARSKHVICEHDISNIFCACQDGESLNYFAYITRDHLTERHYCHVFCVRSTELATEIILTLGEAFEVAYQVAIRENAIEEEDELGSRLDYEGQGHDGNSTNIHQGAAQYQDPSANEKSALLGATAAVDS